MLDIQFGVIVDVEASPGNRCDEVACTPLMLDRIESNYDIKPKRLLGDTAYGTGAMLEWLLEEKQIEPHVSVWDKSIRKDGTFSLSDFIWHDEEDYYQCPAGKRFRRAFKKPPTDITKANTIKYRAGKHDCDSCEYKHRCCPNADTRKITRSIYEAS